MFLRIFKIPLYQNRFFSKKNFDLGGIFPPIITNFTENGSIDLKSQLINLDSFKNVGFRGYVVMGTNGEHVMLSQEERAAVMKAVRERLPQELLIAGVKAESTREAVSQTRTMAESGADLLLVGTPTIFKANLSEDDIKHFFYEVADASSIPILTYNMPSAFGIDLSADLVIATSLHPNIIGFKDSGGDVIKLSRIAYETKLNHFQVLAGGAGFLLPSMIGGCCGGICALGNVLGEELVKLYNLIKTMNIQEAVPLQARMIKPNFLITRKYGVAGLKYAMELFGYQGGPCRSPVRGLSDTVKEEIKSAFKSNGFL